VKANWKLIFENNRECYHCQSGHPEFMKANFDYGVNNDSRTDEYYESLRKKKLSDWESKGLSTEPISFPNGGFYRVARLVLREGFVTESLDGKPVAPLLGDLTDRDVGSVRIITLPNGWYHANSDYVMTTRLTPVSEKLTRVKLTFLVDKDAIEGKDYDVSSVIAVWKNTSEQDWILCENNQAGVNSTRYEPGPYSQVTEKSVEAFADWYMKQVSIP